MSSNSSNNSGRLLNAGVISTGHHHAMDEGGYTVIHPEPPVGAVVAWATMNIGKPLSADEYATIKFLVKELTNNKNKVYDYCDPAILRVIRRWEQTGALKCEFAKPIFIHRTLFDTFCSVIWAGEIVEGL